MPAYGWAWLTRQVPQSGVRCFATLLHPVRRSPGSGVGADCAALCRGIWSSAGCRRRWPLLHLCGTVFRFLQDEDAGEARTGPEIRQIWQLPRVTPRDAGREGQGERAEQACAAVHGAGARPDSVTPLRRTGGCWPSAGPQRYPFSGKTAASRKIENQRHFGGSFPISHKRHDPSNSIARSFPPAQKSLR